MPENIGSNPFADLFKRLETAAKYLDTVGDKPAQHQQAAVDSLVTDIIPGLMRAMAATNKLAVDTMKFMNDTVGVVNDIDRRIGEINERLDAVEEQDASVLLPEDAEKLHNFVVAALGVISNLPATDQARQPMIDLGKEVLEIINEAKLEDQEEEQE